MSPFFLLAMAAAHPARAADRILVARPEQSWTGPAEAPLAVPTSVAADASGGVYVADGVNDRVLHLGADGRVLAVLTEVDGLALANPTAVAATADGAVWIADTGNGRVAVRSPAPGLDHSLRPPAELAAGLDLTGLAVSDDGRLLWLVDNEGHRLLRADLARGDWRAVGGPGGGMGQLQHPFLADAAPDGEVWVSDTLNGRVQVYSAEGEPLRSVGRFGVTPGEQYRPKGVARGEELIWVSDGVLGVVQAYTPGGRLVDVLRDEQGAILRLQAPTGLAVQGDRLWVVEPLAGRVRSFRIDREVGRPMTGNAGGVRSSSDGAGCMACHLEMVPEMSRGAGNLLAPMPPGGSEAPWVASADSCLSCHDGSVLDSRRAVWQLHGHPVDLEIPADMQVPPDLPLSNGKMACRTCHSAHTLGGSGQVHRQALMLRVTDQAEELCTACHGDMMGGGAP